MGNCANCARLSQGILPGMELVLEIFPENVTYENANKEKKKDFDLF